MACCAEAICSIPQPIFVEDRLVAVAATEVNLNKIFYEIKYLDSNTQSYVFLIDRFGLTAYHPHLPRLELFVPIGDIEKEAQEHGVIDSMLRYTTLTLSHAVNKTDSYCVHPLGAVIVFILSVQLLCSSRCNQ